MYKINMAKIELENKIFQFPMEEIEYNQIFMIKNISELTNVLSNIKKEYQLKFLYSNRKIIRNILYEADTNLKIVKENLDVSHIHSFYYLHNIIIDDNIFIINYNYDIDIINELYLRMTQEKNLLRKFIIYILAFPIIYNFKGFNENLNSLEEEKIEEIFTNIKDFIPKQVLISKKFDLNLDLTNYEMLNISNIYAKIIITLIRNKNLENLEYSKDIFEQLDLENIQLSHEMYLQIKNEFDNISDKEYINCYKVVDLDSFIREANINFYYILFKYIFKVSLYIYNIEFLLEARKTVIKFVKNDFYKILLKIINLDL